MADEYKRKGNEFFKQGKFEDAVTWYSKAIEQEPRNEMLYSNRAASYTSLRKDLEALKDAEKCIEIKPVWIKGHFRKGVALSNLNRLTEAVTAFEAALKIEPGNADVQQRLTDTRNALKSQVSGADPSRVSDPAECKKLGNAQFSNGQYPSAIAWYTRAIELTEANPTDDTAVFLCNRAACHAQTHSYKQVVADCDHAISINPKFSKAYLRRAMAFEALEKWKKAADDYKQVMELDPGAANASQGYHRALKFAKDMM